MADNQGLKPIYIEQLFRSKNPGVAKMIPGFIYSYLKKVIHQDDINDFITRYGDRKGLDFSDAILEYLHVSYQVIGEGLRYTREGDAVFEEVEPIVEAITPVPGGVGPMTICCLMENTIECFLRRIARK